MFAKGDFIVFETAGVCKVADVNTVDFRGVDRDKKFYFLEPVKIKGNRLYIPVESHARRMRELVSKEEAGVLLEEAKEIGPLPIPDYKEREKEYKTALKSCDCREWLKMFYTLYRRKQDLTARGKKLPAMDGRYLKMAEECLVTELALVLGVEKEKVAKLLCGQTTGLQPHG